MKNVVVNNSSLNYVSNAVGQHILSQTEKYTYLFVKY